LGSPTSGPIRTVVRTIAGKGLLVLAVMVSLNFIPYSVGQFLYIPAFIVAFSGLDFFYENLRDITHRKRPSWTVNDSSRNFGQLPVIVKVACDTHALRFHRNRNGIVEACRGVARPVRRRLSEDGRAKTGSAFDPRRLLCSALCYEKTCHQVGRQLRDI
jgi:hypothetical protein